MVWIGKCRFIGLDVSIRSLTAGHSISCGPLLLGSLQCFSANHITEWQAACTRSNTPVLVQNFLPDILLAPCKMSWDGYVSILWDGSQGHQELMAQNNADNYVKVPS